MEVIKINSFENINIQNIHDKISLAPSFVDFFESYGLSSNIILLPNNYNINDCLKILNNENIEKKCYMYNNFETKMFLYSKNINKKHINEKQPIIDDNIGTDIYYAFKNITLEEQIAIVMSFCNFKLEYVLDKLKCKNNINIDKIYSLIP